MTLVTFGEIQLKGRKSGKCIKCGKKRLRSTTFYQTLNPFNKNKNGEVKSRHQIMKELIIERSKWMKGKITCERCLN